MSSPFQNRLVGVVILVAAVIIFLPSIIDGKKEKYQDEFVAIPIRPEIKSHSSEEMAINSSQEIVENEDALPEEDGDAVVIDEWHVEELAETVTITTKEKVPEHKVKKKEVKVAKQVKAKVDKPIQMTPPKKTALPSEAWTIQLGAFRNAANINALLKKLKRSGYRVHTIPKTVIDGELTRIFVGPDVSKEKLEKQMPKLKKITKLKGKLVPFDAVNP